MIVFSDYLGSKAHENLNPFNGASPNVKSFTRRSR